MLTVEDIRNPKRRSGFDHVEQNVASPNSGWNCFGHFGFRANLETRNAALRKGLPRRAGSRKRAEEAAQDYCDYINGQPGGVPTALKSAGHKTAAAPERARPQEVQDALGVLKDWNAQKAGVQGYVYCIAELPSARARDGGIHYVKIGYSVNPKKRVAELQTANPRALMLLCMKAGTPADEKALHDKYISANVLQEWFVASRELLLEFDLDPDGKRYPQPEEATTT